MITSFKHYCQLRESSNNLFAYVDYIAKNPNAEDLKTLANMLAKEANPQRMYALFADLYPTIKEIIAKLPPDQQVDVQRHFAKLKHQDPHYDKNMYRHGWRKFTSIQEFEDFIVKEMEQQYPQVHLLMQIIQSNEHLWQNIDQGFKEYFLQWLKEQEAKQRNQQVNWGDIIKKSINSPPTDSTAE